MKVLKRNAYSPDRQLDRFYRVSQAKKYTAALKSPEPNVRPNEQSRKGEEVHGFARPFYDCKRRRPAIDVE
jgi:hypothetical protein